MTDHQHDFPIPSDYQDPAGRPVDMELLGAFIGAAYDGCTTCQDAEMTRLVTDPATTARLVELACVAIQASLGGLPRNMTDRKAPGMTSQSFRALARAGLDGRNDAMFQACAAMGVPRRREAANDAADLLVGQIAMPLGSAETDR